VEKNVAVNILKSQECYSGRPTFGGGKTLIPAPLTFVHFGRPHVCFTSGFHPLSRKQPTKYAGMLMLKVETAHV